MSDGEALELLKLLHKYVKAYTPDIPQTISALADDLADADSSGLPLVQELAKEIRNTEGVS